MPLFVFLLFCVISFKVGVFTEDLIETYINYKRTVEIDSVRLRPHPREFELYYDV